MRFVEVVKGRPEDGQELLLPVGEEKIFQLGNAPDLLKPEKIVALLKTQGVDITIEQATLVLELLDKLSNTIVAQYLRK